MFKPDLEAAEEMRHEGGGEHQQAGTAPTPHGGSDITLPSSTFEKIGLILKG